MARGQIVGSVVLLILGALLVGWGLGQVSDGGLITMNHARDVACFTGAGGAWVGLGVGWLVSELRKAEK